MQRHKDRVVLITGGTRGIGRATAIGFAREGARVAVNYIDGQEEAEALRAELLSMGAEAIAVYADVSRSSDVDAMVERVVSHFGRIDCLVNNAGYSQMKPVTAITDGDWRRMIGVLLDGTFYCSRAVIPHLLAQGTGAIINVASDLGQVGCEALAHYVAAKGGVISLTKAMARELGPASIRVNAVAPGAIRTRLLADFPEGADPEGAAERYPLRRLGNPEEVAAAILFLAGEEASFFTGQVLSPNGGIVM